MMRLTYTELVEGVLNPFTGNDRSMESGSIKSVELGSIKPPTPLTPNKAKPTALDQIKARMNTTGSPTSTGSENAPPDQSEEWVKDMAGFKATPGTGNKLIGAVGPEGDIFANAPTASGRMGAPLRHPTPGYDMSAINRMRDELNVRRSQF